MIRETIASLLEKMAQYTLGSPNYRGLVEQASCVWSGMGNLFSALLASKRWRTDSISLFQKKSHQTRQLVTYPSEQTLIAILHIMDRQKSTSNDWQRNQKVSLVMEKLYVWFVTKWFQLIYTLLISLRLNLLVANHSFLARLGIWWMSCPNR